MEDVQAEAARELLEIIAEQVAVEPSEVGYMIGKGGENIRELQVFVCDRVEWWRCKCCL